MSHFSFPHDDPDLFQIEKKEPKTRINNTLYKFETTWEKDTKILYACVYKKSMTLSKIKSIRTLSPAVTHGL
jgi:hypothetical protein